MKTPRRVEEQRISDVQRVIAETTVLDGRTEKQMALSWQVSTDTVKKIKSGARNPSAQLRAVIDADVQLLRLPIRADLSPDVLTYRRMVALDNRDGLEETVLPALESKIRQNANPEDTFALFWLLGNTELRLARVSSDQLNHRKMFFSERLRKAQKAFDAMRRLAPSEEWRAISAKQSLGIDFLLKKYVEGDGNGLNIPKVYLRKLHAQMRECASVTRLAVDYLDCLDVSALIEDASLVAQDFVDFTISTQARPEKYVNILIQALENFNYVRYQPCYTKWVPADSGNQ